MQIATNFVGVVSPDQVPKGIKNPLWWRVGDRLRALGLENHLTQTKIGNHAGLTGAAISNIERDRHAPRLDTVERLATALGISPVWLAFGDQGAWRFRQRYPRPVLPHDLPEVSLAVREAAALHKGLGARLSQARGSHGWSLRQLVKAIEDAQKENGIDAEYRLRISPQGILFLEAGERVPSVSTCWLVALGLDVSPGWLAFGEGEGLDDAASGRS